jgi:hypothetical protein
MSKISICCGGVSVEFDGTEEFIKQELIGLVSKVAELVSTTPSVGPLGDHANKLVSSKSGLNLSTKTIYSKLGEESGRGLAIAAAAYLTLVNGAETFSQLELRKTMKSATGIYDEVSHGSNLSKIVSKMIKDDLLQQTSSGQYSLAQNERDKIWQKLNGQSH